MSLACIFAFGGLSKSGKTTLARQLAAALGVPCASFGDYVRKVAERKGIRDPSIAELQELGLSLVETNLTRFCELVLAESSFEPGKGLVIDGIRHLDTMRILQTLVGDQPLKLAYVESSSVDRKDRGSFTADQLRKIDSHRVERETLAVKERADIVLDTSLLSPAACLDRLCDWARNCNGN